MSDNPEVMTTEKTPNEKEPAAPPDTGGKRGLFGKAKGSREKKAKSPLNENLQSKSLYCLL